MTIKQLLKLIPQAAPQRNQFLRATGFTSQTLKNWAKGRSTPEPASVRMIKKALGL